LTADHSSDNQNNALHKAENNGVSDTVKHSLV
jgi:hypothetical protein